MTWSLGRGPCPLPVFERWACASSRERCSQGTVLTYASCCVKRAAAAASDRPSSRLRTPSAGEVSAADRARTSPESPKLPRKPSVSHNEKGDSCASFAPCCLYLKLSSAPPAAKQPELREPILCLFLSPAISSPPAWLCDAAGVSRRAVDDGERVATRCHVSQASLSGGVELRCARSGLSSRTRRTSRRGF